MSRSLLSRLLVSFCGLTLALCAADAPWPLQGEPLAERLALVGQVQPRHATTIADNPWSVGGETMDRGYSDYWKWRSYLGELGVKRVRIQSGWQRTDAGKGVYDFSWIEPVVTDMAAQGVRPWVCLCYGNENYEGGGTARRDSALPSGAGLDAWLAYVRATATLLKGKVSDYEIWNEPDLNVRITAEQYGAFAYATARAIHESDPDAGIILGAFAHAVWQTDSKGGTSGRAFARTALERFVALGGRELATAVSFHVYHIVPERVHDSLPSFRELVHSILPGVAIRQGESGAPSLNQQHYALRNLWWTEERQAKFLLRRMLGDWARGVPTSVFSLTEMHFPVAAETGLSWHGNDTQERPAAETAKHFKGLLETRHYAPGTPADDKSVVRTKMGYPAMQAVTSIFDGRLAPVEVPVEVTGSASHVAAFLFRRDDGLLALALWRDREMPGANPNHELVDVRIPGVHFGTDPRYVDLLTRAVYRTAGVVRREGKDTVILGLPIYDAPVLIIDAALVNAR